MLLGGSRFVINLIQELLFYNNCSLSLLIHKTLPVVPKFVGQVRLVKGNLFNKRSLDTLIEPDSIVINLAYLNNETRALNKVIEKVTVCTRKKDQRFIHISTAVVRQSKYSGDR